MCFCFTSLRLNAQTSFIERSTFTLEEEFRLKDQSGLFYEHTDIQYKYAVNKYFDMFTDYRLIFSSKNNSWSSQNMFLEGFNIKYPEQSWGKVNLRTRIEITQNPSPKPDTYYLNVFPKYNTPWKWTHFKINPFVADELFFDTLNNAYFVKNRVYGGFDYVLIQHVKGSLYYYHESSGNSQSEVAVAQIKFEF